MRRATHPDRPAPGAAARRDGFALLAVLWTMVGLSALALLVQLAAREAVQSVTRRIELAAGAWAAESCIARAQAVMDQALAGERPLLDPVSPVWRSLPGIVDSSPVTADCREAISLTAAGSVVDVNQASAEELRRLFRVNTRIRSGLVDSLVDSIQDWRDQDDLPRPHGAERAWYEEHGLHPPRNGPFEDVREIARVRGTDAVQNLDVLMGVDAERLSLAVAPLGVLASLPGMTEEVLAVLDELRSLGEMPATLASFTGFLSGAARDSILANFAELSERATIDPEAWILTVRGKVAPRAAIATIELRLVRAGARAAVVRRREWP